MENPLLCPDILQIVFDFLNAEQVYECRLVCRTWYREANHWLKVPSFDIYYYSATTIRSSDEVKPFGAVGYSTVLGYLSLLEPSTMSRDYYHYSGWDEFCCLPKFSGQGIDIEPSTMIETGKALKFALEGGVRSIPELSLIVHSGRISSEDYRFFKTSTSLISLETLFLRGFPEVPWESNDPVFYAFHIEQFAPHHKVIITNWSDPLSSRPILDDPEFPVKTLFYFCQTQNDQGDHDCWRVRKFAQEANLSGSGACFNYDHPCSVELVFSSDEKRQYPPKIIKCLSVAFAGRNVESASLKLSNESPQSARKKLSEFKKNLTFPTNDRRVFALWFVHHGIDRWNEEFRDTRHYEIFYKLFMEIFPKVIILPLIDRFDHIGLENDSRMDQMLHLVRL
ncbi:uncharacterized protein LOC141857840 [Brevipalpus obovatus]|uniref:uncharacterized protein LOC141857840 n=1 Tax=Brevipalpus obovatus TaxID=246614 RepID=UPI003D9E3B84